MNDHSTTGTHLPLTRPGYAKRFGASLLVLAIYYFFVGFVFGSAGSNDPMGAWENALGFMILGNVVAGIYFVLITYRRALDCKFGKKGWAAIGVVAALPTLALPNLSFIVFGVMMLLKSGPDTDEAPYFAEHEGALPPLPPAG